jgi:hypothetical protein
MMVGLEPCAEEEKEKIRAQYDVFSAKPWSTSVKGQEPQGALQKTCLSTFGSSRKGLPFP